MRILVVEDCSHQAAFVKSCLDDLYHVEVVATGEEASDLLRDRAVDLLLLDIGLPDLDGYRLLSLLRANGLSTDVPVIFLTACRDPADKALAFAIGAADFVEKPFQPLDLRARIAARLRDRAARDPRVGEGPLRLDLLTTSAFRVTPEGMQEIDLTPTEFRLLACLLNEAGKAVSRKHLWEQVWRNTAVSGRTLDSHIHNLRRKLRTDDGRIEAVRGIGYRYRG